MNAIFETISSIKIGAPATFRNLTLFPLADGVGNTPDYLTLDEALAGKSAHITEVSEEQVPPAPDGRRFAENCPADGDRPRLGGFRKRRVRHSEKFSLTDY